MATMNTQAAPSDPWAWNAWAQKQDPNTFGWKNKRPIISEDLPFLKESLTKAGKWNTDWDSQDPAYIDTRKETENGTLGSAATKFHDLSSLDGYYSAKARSEGYTVLDAFFGPDDKPIYGETYSQRNSGSLKTKDYATIAAMLAAGYGAASLAGTVGAGAGAGAAGAGATTTAAGTTAAPAAAATAAPAAASGSGFWGTAYGQALQRAGMSALTTGATTALRGGNSDQVKDSALNSAIGSGVSSLFNGMGSGATGSSGSSGSGGNVYQESDGQGGSTTVNPGEFGYTEAGGGSLWDRFLASVGNGVAGAIGGGSGQGGNGGSGGQGGAAGLSPFQLAWALSQYNKLKDQADQARQQYGEAAQFQQQQITRTTDLADAFKTKVLGGLDSNGRFSLPSATGQGNYAEAIGDDGVGRLAEMMGGDRNAAQALLQRVQSGNPGAGDLDRLQALASVREGRNTTDKAALDAAIAGSTAGLRGVQTGLGDRQVFTDADVQRRAGEIEANQIGGVDRALDRASSQGFAASLRGGLSDSTQAGDARDDVVRRFSDIYGNLKNSSRNQAMGEINALAALQQGQRANALGEESVIQNPELQSRIATYRPDNTAVDAARFGAEFDASQQNRLQSLYQILSGNANASTGAYAAGASRGADRRLQATQQEDAMSVSNNSATFGPLLAALSNLNSQANTSAADMTRSATSSAKDAVQASGVALNRAITPVAQGADNFLSDFLRRLTQGGD